MAPRHALSPTIFNVRSAVISAYRQKASIVTAEDYALLGPREQECVKGTLQDLGALHRRLTRQLDGSGSASAMTPFSPMSYPVSIPSSPALLPRRRRRSDSLDCSNANQSNAKRQKGHSVQVSRPPPTHVSHSPQASRAMARTVGNRDLQRIEMIVARAVDKTITYEELIRGYLYTVYRVWDPIRWDNEGWVRTFSANIDVSSAAFDCWVSAMFAAEHMLILVLGSPY
jgi:hypothetical protein